MTLGDFEPLRFILCLAISVSVNFFFLRKHLFGILDPWIRIFLRQSIIMAVLGYFTWTGMMLPEHFVYVLFCYFFLLLGMQVFYKRGHKAYRVSCLLSSSTLPMAIVILLCILVINNLLIYHLLGIPALLSGPKGLTLYSTLGRGGGVFNYLNTGLLILLPVFTMKLLLTYNRKKLAYASLFILALVLIGLGGKTGFLGLFFAYGVSQYYLNRTQGLPVRMPKIAWVFVGVLALIIVHSFGNVVTEGYESSVILAFVRRVIHEAAGPYYYFVGQSYRGYDGLNVLSYHFSQITPYLGFRDLKSINLGVNLTLLSDEAFGTPGFGPNPTLYVVGHIALGYWGVFYCFTLGAIVSFIRYRLKAGFIVYVLLNLLAVSLLSDGTLMPLFLLYALVLSPLVLVAVVIAKGAQSQNRVRILSDTETDRVMAH